MLQAGRVVFGEMDEVVFGKPAAEAVADQVQRLGATRVFLMVSNSLNRNTDEIDRVRRGLGNRCAGTFDRMPPHTPRHGRHRGNRGGAGRTGRPHRHHRRRLHHRRRQGRADVPCQRYPLTRGDRQAAPGEGSRRYRRPTPNEPADGAADQRSNHIVGRRVQRHRRRHRRTHQSEGAAAPSAHHAECGHPRSSDHGAHA